VFAGVRARLPEFVDWHYSLGGEYTRLGMAVLGALKLSDGEFVAYRATAMLFPDSVWDSELAHVAQATALALEAHVLKHAPFGAKVTWTLKEAGKPFLAPGDSAAMRAARDATCAATDPNATVVKANSKCDEGVFILLQASSASRALPAPASRPLRWSSPTLKRLRSGAPEARSWRQGWGGCSSA
jgi:hypothetical protein